MQAASLDHSIWFHRPFRADEWWLYDQWSPSASGGRGLSIGRVFTQDGTLVATVAQEGPDPAARSALNEIAKTAYIALQRCSFVTDTPRRPLRWSAGVTQ